MSVIGNAVSVGGGTKPQMYMAVIARTTSTSYTNPTNEINSYDTNYISYSSSTWTLKKAGTYTLEYACQSAFGVAGGTRDTSTIRIYVNGAYGSRTVTSSASSSTMTNGSATLTLAANSTVYIHMKVNSSGTAPVCYCSLQIKAA